MLKQIQILVCSLSLGVIPASAQQPGTAARSPAVPPGTAARPARPIMRPAPGPPPSLAESSLDAMTNLPIRVTGPDTLQIGKVQLNRREGSITFPATLNLNEGPMEYLLVTLYGKTHESILRTDAQPYHIHIGMLLLGANIGITNTSAAAPPGQQPGPISNPSSAILPGSRITIDIGWQSEGKQIHRAAERLVYSEQAHAVMPKGGWVYTGSRVSGGLFLAQMGGSVVSLITDPDCLVNNVGTGHDNDKIWTVNYDELPPAEVPLQITLKLVKSDR